MSLKDVIVEKCVTDDDHADFTMAALFLDGIPKFSGDDKTLSSSKWAQDIEDNAEIFRWTAQQKLIFARRSLIGTAALWLRSEKAFKTYDDLKAAVQREFPDTVNIKEMHELMTSRKKRRNESYYQYMLHMKELARRAKFPDYVGVQYIIDGIQDHESNKSILYGATSYPALKEKIVLYEKMKSKSSASHTKNIPITKPDSVTTSENKIISERSDQHKGQNRRCFNCGDRSHIARVCPNGIKCFGCNNYGHRNGPECKLNMASARPSSSKIENKTGDASASGSASVGGSAKQFNMHYGIVTDCQPNENRTVSVMSRSASAADFDVMQIQNKIMPGKPMKEVTVKEFTMKALVDTGSDVNLISHECFNAIGARISEDYLCLTGLGHTQVKSLGKVLFNLTIDDVEFKDVLFHIVTKDVMPFHMILGQEFLKNITMIVNGDKVVFLNECEGWMSKLSCFSDSIVEVDHILDPNVKQRVLQCIQSYNPIQVKEAPIQLKIILKDDIPVKQRPRRLSLVEQKLVDDQVSEWLSTGIIRQKTNNKLSKDSSWC
ncbi:uncharacterized protein LOC128199515 [Bicyclus anynana]|uniref:Uncharacterized protein LOC128199515 n=1 Tax=Bicyclus anynana TaxID=110368 RepID=A0ABM3M1T0_BICAN|nr:uncharacterized protein LOC128199515 [Bicyclus anynana]